VPGDVDECDVHDATDAADDDAKFLGRLDGFVADDGNNEAVSSGDSEVGGDGAGDGEERTPTGRRGGIRRDRRPALPGVRIRFDPLVPLECLTRVSSGVEPLRFGFRRMVVSSSSSGAKRNSSSISANVLPRVSGID